MAASSKVLTEKQKEARAIYRALCKRYPDAHCELDFQTPFQLLLATVLSAQCTDKLVNKVTPALFKRYKDPQAVARANILELEELIRPTGFFHTKARNIQVLSARIVNEFQGSVPSSIEDLTSLPGVGRKTANVVRGHAFDIPGITVDTHFGRLARRFGWSTSEDPVKVEYEVGALIPEREWTNLSQRMIWHGRRICHARKPACGACPLIKLCPSYGIGEVDPELALKLVKPDSAFR
jgi:endonuclease-3